MVSDAMAEQKPNDHIIFRDKQARIMLSLRTAGQDWYISALAKASNTTYVHTCNFIAACESIGLAKSEKHGKIKVVRLTDRGVQVADMIAGIYSIISSAPSPQQPQKAQAEQHKDKKEEKEKEK